MNAVTVPLGELASLVSGGTPDRQRSEYYDGGSVPWITSADIIDGDVRAARTHVTPLGIERLAASIAEQGTPLLVTRTGVGKVAAAPRTLAFSQDITAVVPDTAKLDGRYLIWLLRSRQRWLTDRSRGATIKGVTHDIVSSLPVPLSPLDEQRRIARVLDVADRARSMRRRSIESAATLAGALFTATFNGSGPTSDVTTLGEVSEVTSGITKGRRTSVQTLREVPYLAVSNVQDGRLDLTNVESIEASETEIARFRLAPGDLLLTEGGDPDKLGRGTMWSGELDECIHQNHIFRVRIHEPEQVDPAFMQSQLASAPARSYFLRAAKQTTGIASINRTQLRALPVHVPPISLQRSFTERLELASRAAEARERHLDQLDALFASLQHRAFTGGL